LDPRAKGLFVLTISILTFLMKDLSQFFILLLALIPLLFIGQIAGAFLRGLKGLLFLILFILIINTLIGTLNFALITILRITILMLIFSLYFQTTLPEDLTQSLLSFKISYPNAFSLSLAFRFVPTMARETELIMEAQKSRGHKIEEGGVLQQIQNLFPLLVPLLLNSIRRAYYVAEALESRAFGANPIPQFLYPLQFKRKDGVLVILTIVILIGGILFSLNYEFLPGWLKWNLPL
jgi:energy-coupling factor transport system permease protein